MREHFFLSFILPIDFSENMRTNTRIQTIKQMIIDKYDGAIRGDDISMCLEHY